MAFQPDFRIETVRGAAGWTLVMIGELDGGAAHVLHQELEPVLNGPDVDQIVLDMQKISFIDSAGLRAIIQIEGAARQRGRALTLVPAPSGVTELLRATGLAGRLSPGPATGAAADGDYHERVDLTLTGGPSAPAFARAEIREAADHLAPDDLAVVTLLTSELVTNAVIHSGEGPDPAVGLQIITAEGRIRVEVTDPGSGFDPARPEPRPPELGGRGLLLVDRLASRWGAQPRQEGFCVWFELDVAAELDRRLSA